MRKRMNYRLRAIAMAQSLRQERLSLLVEKVRSLDPEVYDWSDLEALGISKTASERVEAMGLSPTMVFCHPDVILADPQLIEYYRGLALLPHKGMTQLGTATKNLEAGKGKLSKERADKIFPLLNEIISTIIENVPGFLALDPNVVIRATVAVTTDGRWRNAIGEEASRIVKEMIVRYFYDEGLVASVVTKSCEFFDSASDLPLEDISALKLVNGCTLRFGTEPDIEIEDAHQKLTAAIEIKGGLDPAGALERYGAAKKSFAKARARNSAVRTMLLMSAITSEISTRASQNTEVHDLVDLNEVLLEEKQRKTFLEELRYKARL